MLLMLCLFARTAAATDRDSHWGPIPAATDSFLFVPAPGERSAWELPLELGYDVVRLPFRALTFAAKRSVIFLDETNASWPGRESP